MKPDTNPFRPARALAHAAVALPILSVLASVAGAQAEQKKVPRPLPVMSDVKTTPIEAPITGPVPTRVVHPELQHARPLPPKTATVAPSAPPIDFSHVFVDEPGDGSTWARGRTYKASFDAEGATYIPFLGSSAPQNYPVRVRIESARVGGAALALSSNGVTHVGEDVTIDRGSLREVWHLTPDAAEQSFVLAARPSIAGELELSLDLETELQPRAAAQGIELANERGSVAISETVVVDAHGTRTHVESRLEGRRLSIRVPADVLASAHYPLAVDPVYTTNALDATANYTSLPDIAAGPVSGNFGAVYQYAYSTTDSDVYAQDLYFGVPQGSVIWIDTTTRSWDYARTACNALNGTYLTIARVQPTPNAPSEIWCRARYTGTASQFPQHVVQDSSLGWCFSPDVGGDPVLAPPTYFMAVWSRRATQTDFDIHGRLINWDGTLVGTTPMFIDNTTLYDWWPRISKTDGRSPSTTQEWNIVWMRGITSTVDIRGAQIHWDGTVTTPAFNVDTAVTNDQYPSCSSLLDGAIGPRPWLVTFARPLGDYDIYAKAMVGSSIVSELNVSVMEGAAIYENQLYPAVDSDGQRFVVAYSESYQGSQTDRDLYAATLHLALNTLTVDEAHQNLDFTGYDTTDARIASGVSDGSQGFPYYGVAWSIYSGSVSQTYTGVYLEPGTVDSFCFGDSSWGNCPCNNFGGPTVGCANSVTNGGGLGSFGDNYVSADTFSLYAYGLPASASCLFFQGASPATVGVPFGDGLRCTSGSTIRVGNKTASNGAASYPEPGDVPLSVKGGIPQEGGTRAYQVWYRNSANFCTPSPFNLTSAVRVLWLR